MEFFHEAKKVRLRNRDGDGKYLVAGDNESSVNLDRNGTLERAKWTVEFVTGSNSIRLKSCYNKYLTVCGEHLGNLTRGREVRQTSSSSGDSSVKWQPIEYGEYIKLKCQRGFLRGYTGLRYRNSIGHHKSDETRRSNCQWNVEIAEPLESNEDTMTHEQPPPQAPQLPGRPQTTTEGSKTRRPEMLRWMQLGVNAVTAATGAAGLGISAAELQKEAVEEEDPVIVDDGDAGDENEDF